MEGPRRRSTSLFITNGENEAERSNQSCRSDVNNVFDYRRTSPSTALQPSTQTDAAGLCYGKEDDESCFSCNHQYAEYTYSDPYHLSCSISIKNAERDTRGKYAHRGLDAARMDIIVDRGKIIKKVGGFISAHIDCALEKAAMFEAKPHGYDADGQPCMELHLNGNAEKKTACARFDRESKAFEVQNDEKAMMMGMLTEQTVTAKIESNAGCNTGILMIKSLDDMEEDVAGKENGIDIANNIASQAKECFKQVREFEELHKLVPAELMADLQSNLVNGPKTLLTIIEVKDRLINDLILSLDAAEERLKQKHEPIGYTLLDQKKIENLGYKDVSDLIQKHLALQVKAKSLERQMKARRECATVPRSLSRAAGMDDKSIDPQVDKKIVMTSKEVEKPMESAATSFIPLPMPDKFDGKSRVELERYLRYFDRALDSRGYKDGDKAVLIGNFVPSLQFTHDKHMKKNASYEEMKAELLNALGSDSSIATFTLRASLDRMKKPSDKFYADMLNEVEQLVAEAYAGFADEGDNELKKILIRFAQEDCNPMFNAAIIPHFKADYNRLKEIILGMEASFVIQNQAKVTVRLSQQSLVDEDSRSSCFEPRMSSNGNRSLYDGDGYSTCIPRSTSSSCNDSVHSEEKHCIGGVFGLTAKAKTWFDYLNQEEIWKETCNTLSSVKLLQCNKCYFVENNGYLIRCGDDYRRRKVVPQRFRETIWKKMLEKLGNFAEAKRSMYRFYFWPEMNKDIAYWKSKKLVMNAKLRSEDLQAVGCVGLILPTDDKSSCNVKIKNVRNNDGRGGKEQQSGYRGTARKPYCRCYDEREKLNGTRERRQHERISYINHGTAQKPHSRCYDEQERLNEIWEPRQREKICYFNRGDSTVKQRKLYKECRRNWLKSETNEKEKYSNVKRTRGEPLDDTSLNLGYRGGQLNFNSGRKYCGQLYRRNLWIQQ